MVCGRAVGEVRRDWGSGGVGAGGERRGGGGS